MANKKIWVGEIYIASELSAEEAAKTMGQPGLSMEVFENRRAIKGLLNEAGTKAMVEAMDKIQKIVGDSTKLSVKFDQYCGCSSCPCSPGFKIIAEMKDGKYSDYRSKEDYRFTFYLGDKGQVHYARPAQRDYLLKDVIGKGIIGEDKWKMASEISNKVEEFLNKHKGE